MGMQERYADELSTRSVERLKEMFPHAEAETTVRAELEAMRAEDKVLIMTDEEERMIRSFRRFKLSCKPGAVFRWQTRPQEGVLVSQETGLVRDPQEVA
jgi:hypothetical protein